MINDKLNTSIEPVTEGQVKYLKDISNLINSDWFVTNKQTIVDEFKLAGFKPHFGVIKNYKDITAKYMASSWIKRIKLSPTFYKKIQAENGSSSNYVKLEAAFEPIK